MRAPAGSPGITADWLGGKPGHLPQIAKSRKLPVMPQIVYGRQTSGRLNRDELYVNLGCFRKCAQVAGIRGEDVVAVGCEAYHSGI